MWQYSAIGRLERGNRNVLFCCRGGVRRWLDWVQEVKCLSLVTIGGLAFLHQNGPVGWPSNWSWMDPPTPHYPTRHAIIESKPGSGSQCSGTPFPWDNRICRHLVTIPILLPEPYQVVHHQAHTTNMSFPARSMQPHIRQPSMAGSASSAGQSPALVARVNEKKAELENLRELRDLSAAVASQMEALEQKLATLSDGTEGIVLGQHFCP